MQDFIELFCECGKMLRVPKARAGQTGKCSKCGRTVTIPYAAADSAPIAAKNPPKLTPQIQESLDSLSKTAYRMPALPKPPTETMSPFQKTGEIGKTIIRPLPLSKQNEPVSPFHTTPSSPMNMPGMRQNEPLMPPPPKMPYGVPVPQPPQQDSEHICPQCGQSSPIDMEHCQFCGTYFTEQVITSSAMERPSRSKKAAGKKGRGTPSWVWITLPLTFISGIFVGLLAGPGYLNWLPSKDSLMGSSEKVSDKPVEIEIPTPTPPKNSNSGNPEVVMNNEKNPDKRPDSSPSQPPYDKETKAKLDQALENVRAYLTVMDKEYGALRKMKDKMDAKYSVYLEDIEKVYSQSSQIYKALQQRVKFANEMYSSQKWDRLDQAYGYFKEYRNLDPKDSKLITEIQRATKKLEEQYAIFEKTTAQNASKASGASCMGEWYSSLKRRTDELEKLAQENFSVPSMGASMKLQKIQMSLKRVSEYKRDIGDASLLLQQAMNTRDVKQWIQWRMENAKTQGQQRQAKLIDDFLQKDKKFDLDAEDEIKELSEGTGKLRSEVKSGSVTEETLKQILNALESMDRKYKETYSEFNSGILNFDNWKQK